MSRIPQDTTKIFTDVFTSEDNFITSWEECGLYEEGLISQENVSKLYFLLFSKFGNSAIANLDEEQFKYKVYATMFQYGPTWQKRLEIQKKLRNLSDDELMKGSKAIYNHAYNPSTDPSTCTLEEILTVNDQNTTNFKKSKIEGYGLLLELLEADVTEEFIRRFKPFFATFVYTRPDLFITEGEE